MTLPRWLRNWADTADPDADPAPLDLPLPPADALARVEAVVGALPNWRVESSDAASGGITATRRTRLRFVDDLSLRLEPTATGTRLHARSASRFGALDLGQNRRNLRELFAALGRASGGP